MYTARRKLSLNIKSLGLGLTKIHIWRKVRQLERGTSISDFEIFVSAEETIPDSATDTLITCKYAKCCEPLPNHHFPELKSG